MEFFQLVTGSPQLSGDFSYRACCTESVYRSHSKSLFTSGSASLTGVEAISNAVPFQGSKRKECRSNLDHYVTDFRFLLLVSPSLNYWTGIMPQHGETILSQMAQGILGNPFLVTFAIISSNLHSLDL